VVVDVVTMAGTFETWFNAEMARRGIRSAGWLARESGLNPVDVADWMIGRSVPDRAACAVLASRWDLTVDEVASYAVPLARERRR
jgi:hypothetical protein